MKKFIKKIAENGVYILLVLVIAIAGATGYMAKKRSVYESMVKKTAEEIKKNTETAKEKKEVKKEVNYTPREYSDIVEVATVATAEKEEPFTSPALGEVIQEYSPTELIYSKTMQDWRTHSGVDIAGKIGTQVRTVKSGTVLKVYKDEMFGTTVEVEHSDGSVSKYKNLQEGELVDEGSFVEAGQVIGGIGATAACESAMQPHLHFELVIDGKNVNPFDYID